MYTSAMDVLVRYSAFVTLKMFVLLPAFSYDFVSSFLRDNAILAG
jgi:hypothetical protein